jgi:hypothetical protein
MSLTNFNFLNNEADLYLNAKTELDQSSMNIQQTIQENTKVETEAVNNAIKALNQKVENIIQSEQIQEDTKRIQANEKIMMDAIDKAKQVFFKVCDIITSKKLGTDKTAQMQQTAYNKIISKFLTPEESHLFDKLIKLSGDGNITIVPNNLMLQPQLI